MKLHFRLSAILLSFFAFLATAQAGELPFTDSGNYGHFEAVYKMKEWGIFSGYSDGSFGYHKDINRAELSKVLVLSSGMPESQVAACATNATKTFSDVTSTAWYGPYVYCAQSKGWVSGDSGKTTFRPSDPVLLPEAAKMILESQMGTPNSSYAGSAWYDVYMEPLYDADILEHTATDYISYTYSAGYPSVGYDSDIATKMLREDIAELLYRIRTVEQNDELGVYYPFLTLEEYEEEYGATVEEVSSGVLSFEDPHFDFEMTNVYIDEFDADDLLIWVNNPSAFQNGETTDIYIEVPTILHSSYNYPAYYENILSLRITDPDSNPDEVLNPVCYENDLDLWNIADTLCGEDGDKREELSSLLQITAYGEDYSGEEVDLEPAKDSALNIFKYNEIFIFAVNFVDWYSYLSDDYVTYLESLFELESENAEQEEALKAAAEDYLDGQMTAEDFEEVASEFELEYLENSFSDTFTLELDLTAVTSYNHPNYINYDVNDNDEPMVTDGEVGEYFWQSYSLEFSRSHDPFDAYYFGSDRGISGETIRITVKNEPILYDEFDVEDTDLHHVFVYSHGFINAYRYEIIDVEVVEE